jgi:sulfofructose kinase
MVNGEGRDEIPSPIDVLCVGRACVDEILEVDAYPAEDFKAPLLARLREGGGQASTAACLVAWLGGTSAFAGVLGDDGLGRFARARMEAFGVRVFSPAPRGATPLAYCVVSRSAGSRTIFYEPSAAKPLAWEELDPELLARSSAILVDPQASHLLPRLKTLSAPVVADAERAGPAWEETWGAADFLAASERFLREAAPGVEPEEALRRIAARSRGQCVATLGERGAIALLGSEVVRIRAPRVEVRDTTGAGDAFHAALCLALTRGFEIPDALRYAVAAASLCCRGLGGRSFPAPEEVDALWPTLAAVA